MKRFLILGTLAALLLSGCKEQLPPEPSSSVPEETTVPATTLAAEPTWQEDPFDFSQLEYLEFHYNSGAGAWGTVLIIRPDGSFWGPYQDTDMGDQDEAYPNGSFHISNFSGQSSQLQRQDAYTGVLKIEELHYDVEPGTVEIRDGARYSYTTAYGLTETEELVLYLPGKPLEQLPEQYLSWANLYGYEGTVLPHYGLYNPGHETGFYSLNILDAIRSSVETAEKAEADIDLWLETHYTQADMNDAAQQKYQVWDDALNQLWADLKGLLGEEEMRELTNEELAWIREKEAAALEAAAEYEGGSIYPAVYSGTLTSLTKQRVYELLEYLPDSQ